MYLKCLGQQWIYGITQGAATGASSKTVTIQTNPPGLEVAVGGVNQVTPYSWNCSSGSQSLDAPSSQSGGIGVQYVYASWSDGGSQSRTIACPASNTTYTANFTTQYYLAMSAGAGGTVSPPSGWYNPGQSVNLSANPSTGYGLSGWMGAGMGSYSGISPNPSITMTAPVNESARFATSPPTVIPISVSPTTGSGAQQIFTATYSNAGSAQSVYIMVSSGVQPQASCFAEYDAGPNQFKLIADNGADVSIVTPGSGSASNSQCTLSGVGAAAATVGNNLSVAFPLSFSSNYVGAKNVFLFALSSSGQNSGWVQLGAFTVMASGGLPPGAVPVCNPQGFPCVASLTPTNGTGLGNTFTGVFTHSGGATQHYLGYILFLPTPNIVWYTATGSCLVEYNRISNAMRLINDAGTNWLPGIIGLPIGVVGSLTNSHCTLNVGESSATINGTIMTVNAAVTFNPDFTGHLATFMQAFDVTGAYTGMTQFGNWEVYAGTQRPGPYVVDVSPTSGSGSSSTFTFTAGHTSGVSSLSFVTMLISSVIVGGNPCQAFYFQAANVLNLVNDTGTAMVSTNGISPGTAGTLANSRCSIDTGTASANVSGDSVTVSLPMTFDPSTFGGVKNIYLNAFDDFGYLSHWVTSAMWTVQ